MRFGRVTPDDEDGFGVVDVVVGIGHCAVAPGIGYAGDGGGVADTSLVVHVVGAPVGRKLTEQVGLLVVELCAAQPVDRIGTALLTNFEHLVADFVDGGIPGNLLPLAVDHFHGRLETTLAVGMLPYGSAFGAVSTQIEGAVPAWFLPDPCSILHFSLDRAAYRTVRTNGFFDDDFATPGRWGRSFNPSR